MTIMPNSIEGRDMAYQMHPMVNLRKYEKSGGLVIESGDGIYVFDNTGKRYIEGLAGLWSVALGFGEKRLAEVAKAQMEKLPYYHTFAYKTHGPSIELAEMLIQMAPVPMSKAHFTSSGSEANDLACKMVWYRSNALGNKDKKKIIGRIKGYHGVTIASGSIRRPLIASRTNSPAASGNGSGLPGRWRSIRKSSSPTKPCRRLTCPSRRRFSNCSESSRKTSISPSFSSPMTCVSQPRSATG